MERLGRMRQQRPARGVVGGLDHVRAHQVSAVGDRRVGDRELNWRDSHALAEAMIGEIDLAPRRGLAQDTARLARQIDPGASAKAEGAQSVVEALGTQLERNFGGADIRGDFDYPAQIQPSVRTVIVDHAMRDRYMRRFRSRCAGSA